MEKFEVYFDKNPGVPSLVAMAKEAELSASSLLSDIKNGRPVFSFQTRPYEDLPKNINRLKTLLQIAKSLDVKIRFVREYVIDSVHHSDDADEETVMNRLSSVMQIISEEDPHQNDGPSSALDGKRP